MTGRLVLVGTPLGNLGDLTPRAVENLRAADCIACEDTRRTGRLLELAGIDRVPFVVVNEHTEASATTELLQRVRDGQTVAVVTDAGMPGISDPGERVVAAAWAARLPVEVVPGPTALVTALVGSGLPPGRFVFEGFLPRKGRERRERLAAVAAEPRTVVLYEAPHRLLRTLEDLIAVCGGTRRVGLARELTKLHEERWRGSLAGAVAHLEESPPRGEFVVVLDGVPDAPDATDDELRAALDDERAAGSSARDAARAVAERFGVPKRRVYDLATGRR